jgi:hypothetical protein
MRMAFDSSLINKGWDFKEPKGIFKRYFVEVDLPFEFNRPVVGPDIDPFTFAMHFGLAF